MPLAMAASPISGLSLRRLVKKKVGENPTEKQGVKGTLPLRCLPLWGREGVTLITLMDRSDFSR